MAFGQFTFELIQSATVWAASFAAMIEWNHHFGVGVPNAHARHRADQRQVMRGDFKITLGDVLFAHSGLQDNQPMEASKFAAIGIMFA
jgi:hypothetical protein